MKNTEILSTKPQFPELLLKVFGNSGVLSYKIKCLSIGLVLYSLGIFTTFITNQPDTIQQNIYRQADNIFLFNFTNENDLEAVSKAAKVDAETVKLIAIDGGKAIAKRTDVSSSTDVQVMVDTAVEEFGGLNFAHNNAGIEGALA